MKIGRKQLPEYIQKNFNKYKYVLLVCLVGLLLAAWPSEQSNTTEQGAGPVCSVRFPETQELEHSLEEILSRL